MQTTRRQFTRSALSAIAALAGSSLALAAGEQEGDFSAKALFYNADGALVSVQSGAPAAAREPSAAKPAAAPSKRPASPRPTEQTALALRGTVLLVGPDGGTREVKPSHIFSSGDRIKVAFTSNRPGYMYVIGVGPSGRAQLLAPRKGEPATVQPGYRYQFPGSPTAYFRLDHQAGQEEIWAVLSDQPLDVVRLGQDRLVAINQPQGAAPSAQESPGSRVADAGGLLASKDLVFEEDSQAAYSSMRPAALGPSVTTLPLQAVTLKMTLSHRP